MRGGGACKIVRRMHVAIEEKSGRERKRAQESVRVCGKRAQENERESARAWKESPRERARASQKKR